MHKNRGSREGSFDPRVGTNRREDSALWRDIGEGKGTVFSVAAHAWDGELLGSPYKSAALMLQVPAPPPPLHPGPGLSCTGYLGWEVRPGSGRAARPRPGAAGTGN